ncbi:four helix bundle protein [Candidatus Falkowbacteria bacterium]|jgi:four helix bundle protein|nr:four helix bundle protein [Candidatus Falkowbacteria bacterium]MBT7007304.1 four helix bundle protein [Candidatus Falkowbacteria bacterium]
MNNGAYHEKLKKKIKEYVHLVFEITRDYPKDESYCLTSQTKRSALSVLLNYVEGFARFRPKVNLNFLEIAYG